MRIDHGGNLFLETDLNMFATNVDNASSFLLVWCIRVLDTVSKDGFLYGRHVEVEPMAEVLVEVLNYNDWGLGE